MSFHKGLHVAGNTSILNTLEHIEEGRSDIYKWSENRLSKRKGIRGKIFFIKKLFINRSMLRSFAQNFSLIVAFQMLLAGLFTYMCTRLELDFDVNMALFVSPVIFPLAFSINADFQRRERVLEDLALFKGALVVLFFCHRDWLTASELEQDFLKTVNNKLRGLVLNIKEYLLTENLMRRQFILSVIYEDFSDISQLNDKMRGSALRDNSPLITRLIHYHNHMCWAFERLRVVREYRSPRTIRSFTKVFIFLMPILLSPYYVHVGKKSGNVWSPYYVAVLSSFIFGSLQGVQDVLDDPFDGISEDDINLGQLEDWTMQSLLTNRTIHVGRFTVTTAVKGNVDDEGLLAAEHNYDIDPPVVHLPRKRSILKRNSTRKDEPLRDRLDTVETEAKYPEVVSRLENMEKRGLTGSTTILPGYQLKQPMISGDSLNSSSAKSLVDIFKMRENGVARGKGFPVAGHKTVSFDDDDSSREKCDWTLGNDEIEGLPVSRVKNAEPVPESLRGVALDLENSSGTSLVSSRNPGKDKRKVVPGLAQVFDLPQSSPPDTKVHGDACPAKMPQSLSSLFGKNDQDEAKSSTPEQCRRCSCGETPTRSDSLPNTPTRTRRTPTSFQKDPFEVPVSPISSTPEAPPVAKTDKPRFAIGRPAVTSAEYPSPSCSVPILESRFRKKSLEKPPQQSSPEQQPLMSTPPASYGMTSSSPNLSSSHPQDSISKPSRFAVAKSSGIDSSPQVHDTISRAPDQLKRTDESDSIEMTARKTSQGNRSVKDVLNLSHDDSEVYL